MLYHKQTRAGLLPRTGFSMYIYALHVRNRYPPYTASRATPCHRWNRAETMAGMTAIHPTSRHAGRSMAAETGAMGRA